MPKGTATKWEDKIYPSHGLVYRDLLDPIDNKRKRFYYLLQNYNESTMYHTDWWGYQIGYEPTIPWENSGFWRQAYKYLGCE